MNSGANEGKNPWLEYDAAGLAEGVAITLEERVPRCRVLVLNPHQGLRLDDADRRCLLALSGADALVIARSEKAVAGDDERVFEVNLDGGKSAIEKLASRLESCESKGTPPAVSGEDLLALIRASEGLGASRSSVLTDAQLFVGESPAAGQQYLDGLASALYDGVSKTAAELFYLFTRLAQRQAAISHHLKGRLEDRRLDLEAVGRYTRTAQLVESSAALRGALRARWGAPRLELGAGDRQVVLFIDDGIAEPLQNGLQLIARILWRGAQLLLWNPTLGQGFGIKEILHLGALGSLLPVNKKELEIWDFTDRGSSSKLKSTLGELLSSVTHLVVDQFFDERGGNEGVRGPELIRFLKRSVPAVKRGGFDHRPRVVAFSRTEDPELIATAIRAGADGYVLKTAPLRLTEYIIGSSPDLQATSRFSRNFECLDRLPPALRGLITMLEIPPIQANGEEWYRSRRLSSDAVVSGVARLLRAIPKAELHVHVGSCMSREFLVLASVLGLASKAEPLAYLRPLAAFLKVATESNRGAQIRIVCNLPGLTSPAALCFSPGLNQPGVSTESESWLAALAGAFRSLIETQLAAECKTEAARASQLRSFLHGELGIPDYESPEEARVQLRERPSLSIVLTVLRTAMSWSAGGESGKLDLAAISAGDFEAAFVRIYLLVLADRSGAAVEIDGQQVSADGTSLPAALRSIRVAFFDQDAPLSVAKYRDAGWRTPQARGSREALSLVKVKCAVEELDLYEAVADPIGYTLASGLRSRNLAEYLEGCEFSGSLHLQHPYLIHLYAEQVLFDMVREGAVYRELRGSPDGYANPDIGFSFGDACSCLVTAFGEGQRKCVGFVKQAPSGVEVAPGELWLPELAFGESWKAEVLASAFTSTAVLERRLPPKVGLLLVGKRHKSSRAMMLEAAAGAVLYQESTRGGDVGEGVLEALAQSGIVGFDLAGKESGDYPTALFAAEFERLGKLHIPLTVHAGENASSQFVEDAVLILGARRIGHALSLADDRHLMSRLREDRICVELCPVSNHQTSHFAPAEEPFGRKYPLEAYLDAGIPVCLNTDNPIISRTDLINEFFVASSTFRDRKLTLWLALLLIKTAFRSAFLPLPQRKVLMQAVDNYIENLLLDRDVIELLESVANRQPKDQAKLPLTVSS